MKKLEIQYKRFGDMRPDGIVYTEIDHEATLQALCDAVNRIQSLDVYQEQFCGCGTERRKHGNGGNCYCDIRPSWSYRNVEGINEAPPLVVAHGHGGTDYTSYKDVTAPDGQKGIEVTTVTPKVSKRFKATDIYIEDNSWNEPTIVFESEAEAQAALELLLNL